MVIDIKAKKGVQLVMRESKKDWKKYETLVKMIEAQLCPRGAQVKSPDHIRDEATGSTREVDVSIRYAIGSTPMLIIIECRKRNAKDDVTWIEQVKTKRDDTHADIAIAVSEKGFTRNAIIKADAHNIRTRTLSEIKSEDIEKWLSEVAIIIEQEMLEIVGVSLKVPEEKKIEIEKISSELNGNIDVKTKFIKRIADGKMLCIEDYLIEYQKSVSEGNKSLICKRPLKISEMTWKFSESYSGELFSVRKYPFLFESITRSGEKYKKNFVFSFSDGECLFKTASGEVEALEVDVKLMVWKEEIRSDIDGISNYKNGDNLIATVGQSEVEAGPIGKMKLTVIKNYSSEKK